MSRIVKISFLIIMLLLCAWIALSNLLPFLPKEELLGGAWLRQQKPVFSWTRWFNGSYQEEQTKYIEENAGYRSWLIRVRNQIDFDLFRHVHADDVFVGKNNYLFRPSDLHDINGNYGLAESEWVNRARVLKEFHSLLAARQIPLIVVIAPSKVYYSHEHIPADWLRPGAQSHYATFRHAMDTLGINLVDMNPWFLALKSNTAYPLYSKTGIHWTEYGAIIAMDSILRYAGKITGKRYPALHWDSVRFSNVPSHLDADVLDAINLLKPFSPGTLAYPVLNHYYPKGIRKPNMLVVGDSYYHALLWSGIHSAVSDSASAFWYYGKEAFTSAYSGKPVSELNMTNEMEGRDFVLMLYTPANLYQSFWYLPWLLTDSIHE